MTLKTQSGASGERRQRWPINEEVLQKIIQQQREDALNPRLKERDRRAAQKVVMEFEANRKQASENGSNQQSIPHSKVFFDLPPVAGKQNDMGSCDLSKLNDSELNQLEALLLKASGTVTESE